MKSWTQRAVTTTALIYLMMLLAGWAFIRFDNGSNWIVTLFLFAPRWVLAVPLLILVPVTLFVRFQMTPVYLLHGAVILFPLLGFHLSWSAPQPTDPENGLRLMTYNVGGGKISTDAILSVSQTQGINVLMLQECSSADSKTIFDSLGWNYRQEGYLAIGSAFDLSEVRFLARQPESYYHSVAAISCELELPSNALDPGAAVAVSDVGTIQLVCVHLPTFRPALERARQFDLKTRSAIAAMAGHYRDIAETVQQQVQTFKTPTIVAGDFNVPVESIYYRDYWTNFRNALSRVGIGFGYTKHTRFHGIRIDHVLVDDAWTINRSFVGPNLGGDHSPVIAELLAAD